MVTPYRRLAIKRVGANDAAIPTKRKKARQLAEIGFASQKRAEAEEARKTERHAVQIATAKLRKQREEMKLGDAIAKMLPPDFDLCSLDQIFSLPSRQRLRPLGGLNELPGVTRSRLGKLTEPRP